MTPVVLLLAADNAASESRFRREAKIVIVGCGFVRSNTDWWKAVYGGSSQGRWTGGHCGTEDWWCCMSCQRTLCAHCQHRQRCTHTQVDSWLSLRRVQSDATELNLVFDELTDKEAVMHYSRHRLTASVAYVTTRTYATTNDR